MPTESRPLLSRVAANRRVRAGCEYGWLALLLAPAATVFSPVGVWDMEPTFMVLVTVWFFVLLRTALGFRLFMAVTYPLALLSVLCVGADLLRGANLVELIMISRGGEASEALDALAPYSPWIVLAGALLLIPQLVFSRPVEAQPE